MQKSIEDIFEKTNPEIKALWEKHRGHFSECHEWECCRNGECTFMDYRDCTLLENYFEGELNDFSI